MWTRIGSWRNLSPQVNFPSEWLQYNGHQQALNPRLKSLSQQGKLSRVAAITHMQTTFNHISWLLTRINIKTAHSYKKECWLLRPEKHEHGFWSLFYSILFYSLFTSRKSYRRKQSPQI
jgi:hypothetical protein